MKKTSTSQALLLRTLSVALLLVSGFFLAFHFLHLQADFPNFSPWMDWSKYTDEGWYGDAAIRHYLRGHWYVPGDFNPAAALPVWPLLEAVVFHFTGVSLTAARALTVTVFALILVVSYLLIARWDKLSRAATLAKNTSNIALAPSIAVLLLSVSPFCFVFTRLAILEPLLILLTLLALFATSYLQPSGQGSLNPFSGANLNWSAALSLGLLVPAMVLTKTTAVFLLPSIAWLLWARAGYRLKPFLQLAILPGTVAAATWLAYYLVLVRPRYLLDYRYLFSANAYTGITASTALSILAATIADGAWMGKLLFPLALLATFIAVLNPRLTLRNPLVPALLFWAAGYTAFLAYHNNLQPRYYLVIAVPLTLLVPIVFESLWRSPSHHPHVHAQLQSDGRTQIQTHSQTQAQAHPIAAAALILALLATAAIDASQTLRFLHTPEYTFVQAAAQVRRIIDEDHRLHPDHNPLVLSISGSNLSLMTGLLSICDDFGTMELPDRIRTYRPGWFVTWNEVDDDKMDALSPLYQLQRVAEFPVMDDPERNLLILYRLNPAPPSPTNPRRRRPIPRRLQTKLGQQPSATQLEH